MNVSSMITSEVEFPFDSVLQFINSPPQPHYSYGRGTSVTPKGATTCLLDRGDGDRGGRETSGVVDRGSVVKSVIGDPERGSGVG